MNICINQKILDKYKLSLEEFLVLFLCSKDVNIQGTIDNLIEKGIAQRDLYNNVALVTSNNTKELISSILISSDKAVVNRDEEFQSLAEKMRNIFPAGKKPETTYLWRDAPSILATKLKTVVAKFGFEFTEEEALQATQEYVDSFRREGNFRFMQLCKYFILKKDPQTQEFRSDFMSLICEIRDRKNTELPEEPYSSGTGTLI